MHRSQRRLDRGARMSSSRAISPKSLQSSTLPAAPVLQRKYACGNHVDDVIASRGESHDGASLHLMSSRIGHDFSHIRVHTDSRAAKSASSVRPLAYTVGNHAVF